MGQQTYQRLGVSKWVNRSIKGWGCHSCPMIYKVAQPMYDFRAFRKLWSLTDLQSSGNCRSAVLPFAAQPILLCVY